jgi:hypothetical protein
VGDACTQGVTVVNIVYNQKAATVTWSTTSEINIQSFNIVQLYKTKIIPVNPGPISCKGCSDGLPHSYSFPIAKHKNGQVKFYIQMFTLGHPPQTFGPAVRTN